MSRSGYSDDYACEDAESQWRMIRWRGAVTSALRGKRGQTFLRELLDALDTMPQKRLIERQLRDRDGEVCALGVVAVKRGAVPPDFVDEPCSGDEWDGGLDDQSEDNAKLLDIARALAAEIMYVNDDWCVAETPEQRWQRVRRWVERQIEGRRELPEGID